VRREQFTPNGAVVHLPYRAKDPELDTSIERQGLVHLRLSVPGHGTFEHSRDAVRIRSYSPVRDTHQRATGRRYFPGERTRGQR